MGSVQRRRASAKLYQQDTVQRLSGPRNLGIVLRCWHDAEDLPPPPGLSDPLLRPLVHGEVGVSFIGDGGSREIMREDELKLVDRSLQPGDFCKCSIEDVQSGVVLDVHVKAILKHVISGQAVMGWMSLDDVEAPQEADIGDYVLYNDWLGQVIELFDENVVEVSTGELVRLPEFSSRLVVGEKGPDILPNAQNGSYRNLFGIFMGNSANLPNDTVIAVKHTIYAIAWLGLNQTLSTEESAKRERPGRFWHGPDISKLTLLRSQSERQLHLSDRVTLKKAELAPITQHGKEEDPAGVLHVQTLAVRETETTIDVLWQDGTKETLMGRDVIPYMNPDEYDCWPGDHVYFKSEGVVKHAVIQSVDAAQRTARITFPGTSVTELVSVLELDVQGTTDEADLLQSAADGLGVRRGDYVFIHPSDSSNGFEGPRVPRIGEIEPWVREQPYMDGRLDGWRREMSDLGRMIATTRSPDYVEGRFLQPTQSQADVGWVGEVVDLLVDGRIKVCHPDGAKAIYPLHRLTRLYDGIEQLEDDLFDGSSDDDGHIHSEQGSEEWAMNEDGVWQATLGEDDDDGWEEYSVDDDEGEEENSMEVDPPTWNCPPNIAAEASPPSPLENGSSSTVSSIGAERLSSPDAPTDVTDLTDVSESELSWKRFDILSDAPVDHAFYGTEHAQPSKAFLGRLTREYRILASSLPDSIVVRAFEDRTDLLRCMIIGPENTPYADAPFVIDWRLDSNFPNSPPIAHFWSWTNGNGRVNPNLYEEGKVCLSILGTWAGDRHEVWSAGRSSLLQAFVSIQGLVLVREPWFCEPAYEKLRNTEEGIVNSRLYSEKAYVLSRGFVRRALELPLGGLQDEIEWLYYKNNRLEKILKESRALIAASREPAEETSHGHADDDAVPRLSGGGIITLERTLTKLQTFLDSRGEA